MVGPVDQPQTPLGLDIFDRRPQPLGQIGLAFQVTDSLGIGARRPDGAGLVPGRIGDDVVEGDPTQCRWTAGQTALDHGVAPIQAIFHRVGLSQIRQLRL